jgi:hypothetical protein
MPSAIKDVLFNYYYNMLHIYEILPNMDLNSMKLPEKEEIIIPETVDYNLLINTMEQLNKNIIHLQKLKETQEITNTLLEVQLEQFKIGHQINVNKINEQQSLLKNIEKSIDLSQRNLVTTLDNNTNKLLHKYTAETKEIVYAVNNPKLVLKGLKEILTAVHHPSALLAELKELNFNQMALYETFNLGVVDICKVLNDKSQLNTVITEMNLQVDTLREQLNDLKNQNKESLRLIQKESKIIEEELEKLSQPRSYDSVTDVLVTDTMNTNKKTVTQKLIDFYESISK